MRPFEQLRWQDYAACLNVDPEIFFPERGGSSVRAKEVCNGRPESPGRPARLPCPVRAMCQRYALENHEQFGIWGGTGEHERRKLRRDGPEEPEQDRRAS